jgi:hypothetical protein
VSTATLQKVDSQKQLKDIIAATYNDRVLFAEIVCNAILDPQQAEGLRALDEYDFVSARSGHGVGKSYLTAIAIWHFLCTRHKPKVVVTAPSKPQLYDVLWAELSKVQKGMKPLFADMFQWTKEKIVHKQHYEEWFATSRTASKDNTESLQGFHAKNIFVVFDEASGVPEEVYDAFEGASGIYETKNLMLGNPTRLNGTFYRSHHSEKDMFKTLKWSCLDSGICNPRYPKRIERKFGLESNMYRIRVLGEFPLREGDAFIPYDLAFDALNREIPSQEGQPVFFGVDVARFGDDSSVIAIRRGDEILPLHVFHGLDGPQLASRVISLANEFKPEVINIDAIGVGSSPVDFLKKSKFGDIINAVNVSELPAAEPENYHRQRDELWGNCREWLAKRGCRIHDETRDLDLLGELTSPRYEFSSKGAFIIESKKAMKKRGVVSPNRADACCLTFAVQMADYKTSVDKFLDSIRDRDDDSEDIFDEEAGY